uniref:Inactive rhomboid protein 1/2 N-terminal domain-containing protein n=1 Tax=Ciona savignyi TaxID=51511 RepID=H2YC35_CIOSA
MLHIPSSKSTTRNTTWILHHQRRKRRWGTGAHKVSRPGSQPSNTVSGATNSSVNRHSCKGLPWSEGRSRRVKQATENFVGLGKNCNEDHERWRKRHLRYCSMKYGRLKPQHEQEVEDQSYSTSPSFPQLPQIHDPYARGRGSRFYASGAGTPVEEGECTPSIAGGPMAVSTPPPRTPVTPGARSIASTRMGTRPTSTMVRKESVAKMSWKVISAVVKGVPVMNNLVTE